MNKVYVPNTETDNIGNTIPSKPEKSSTDLSFVAYAFLQGVNHVRTTKEREFITFFFTNNEDFQRVFAAYYKQNAVVPAYKFSETQKFLRKIN